METQEGSHSGRDREEFPDRARTPADARDAPAPAHRRDAVVVVLVTALAAIASSRFELAETIVRWTRPGEPYQLDELPGVLLVLAIGLAWYAVRRFRDASRELRERRRMEQRLFIALTENRSLAQQYVALQESERKRLARELHDELGQYLNAIKIDAVSIRNEIRADERAQVGALHEAAAAIVRSVDHVHGVVNEMIRRLRPVGLDDLGLAAALEQCVDQWRARHAGTRYTLSIADRLDGLGEVLDLTLYRLVQEGLTNVSRHADARSVVVVIERLHDAGSGSESIALTITDDGVGAREDGPRRGFGLVGMRERVQALGGQFGISTGPGQGWQISARLPVRTPEAAR